MGYWIFSVEENEPFPEPPKNDHHAQRYFLKRLVRWAEELELKVILDLHGAPGSQNGFDNSGRMGPIGRKYTFTFCHALPIKCKDILIFHLLKNFFHNNYKIHQ